MSFNNVYYFARDILWIIPAKNASTSIKTAVDAGNWLPRERALELNHHFTVGVVRHPFERAVSGVYAITSDFGPFHERLRRYIHNSHIRPQAPAFTGLRVDFLLHVERLAEEWKTLQALKGLPDLPYLNAGSRGKGRPADWRDACDWSQFLPLYAADFALCERGC